MTEDVTIHSYANGGIKGKRPRKPMVQMLAGDSFGRVHSVCFHPDDAGNIARGIIRAAEAARTGKRRAAVKIELKPYE